MFMSTTEQLRLVGAKTVVTITAVVSLLLSGVVLFASSSVAGAVPGPSWGTINLPGSLSLPDDNTHFAVDGNANLYVINGTSGVTKYSLATGTTTQLDPSMNFESGYNSYFAVSTAGVVYVVTSNGTIYRIDSSGNAAVYASVPAAGPVAVDAAGNVYVGSFANSNTTIYKFTGGVGSVMGTIMNDQAFSMSVGPNGDVYVVDSFSGTHSLYQVAPNGITTTIISGLQRPESVAVDGANNVYVVDESGATTQYSPSGSGFQSTLLSTPSSMLSLAIGGGTLYLGDEISAQTLYTAAVTPFGAAPVVSLSAQATVAGTRPNYTQTVNATWTGTSSATSYTCTLMFGFNVPSSFSVTTTASACSFSGLALTTEYGIQVVANQGGASSSPVVQFVTPAKLPLTSIVCVRARKHRRITAINPVCPAGFHRV